ncbi:wnt inhibitory factor 1 isoform X8 [Dermacentor albipictus]|uniref:wnt inhibitory factor 1 isoform X8 n=1 Tax=Dermacentor albipictus TaxID=60249 RepID=UPI0038FD15CD
MAVLLLLLLLLVAADAGRVKPRNDDFSLWIDEKQVREFSGFPMEIFAILDGVVLPYILDPNFEKYLPVIPSGVQSVNFTWKAGENKHYYYDFDILESLDGSILKDPVISIETKGKVPRKAKVFQVFLPCWGNVTGTASFGIGLRIENEKGRYLSGTPLRLRLQKQCADNRPDPECDRKCANGGRCNAAKICECPKRYMGRYCKTVHERRNVRGPRRLRLRRRIPGTALRRRQVLHPVPQRRPLCWRQPVSVYEELCWPAVCSSHRQHCGSAKGALPAALCSWRLHPPQPVSLRRRVLWPQVYLGEKNVGRSSLSETCSFRRPALVCLASSRDNQLDSTAMQQVVGPTSRKATRCRHCVDTLHSSSVHS